VGTTGASLDTLNALDAAIMSAKPVVSSYARSDLLLELLKQAEEESLELLREVRAMAKAAKNGDTCVVCLAAPEDSLLLPCKHIAMCAECTKTVVASRSQPQCPVCRSRIAECVYGVFF
jgi:rubrerythrin